MPRPLSKSSMTEMLVFDKVASSSSVTAHDDDQLTRLGKTPVLKRNFSALALLGFSCTILQTWEATLLLFSQGLANGGPAGIVYGFIFIWLGNLSVFSTLSELASMAPTSGGQYHWVAVLAPPRCSKFVSYITGWLVVGGWQGTIASALYITASLIQAVITLNVDDYQAPAYHATMLFWACLAVVVFLNSFNTRLLAAFETSVLAVHITGFFAILIVLVVLSPHKTATEVFTTFNNGGGWSSQGVSLLVGLVGNVFAFVGVDGSFHMSEETRNPAIVVPRATILGLMINGALGFGMILAILFCMGDVDTVLKNKYGFPFVEVFLQSTKSVAATSAMTGAVLLLALAGLAGLFASTSRVMWSFARDHGVPGWQTISKVHSLTAVPLWAVACTACVSFLLSLINLGSTIAFNSVVSLAVSCLYASYLIVSVLFLWRRCTRGFGSGLPASTATSAAPYLPSTLSGSRASLTWGPWRVPGVLGVVNNAFACVYLAVVMVFAFFPPTATVDASTMNWSVLVTGATTLFAVVYYVLWGRRLYTGPVMET